MYSDDKMYRPKGQTMEYNKSKEPSQNKQWCQPNNQILDLLSLGGTNRRDSQEDNKDDGRSEGNIDKWTKEIRVTVMSKPSHELIKDTCYCQHVQSMKFKEHEIPKKSRRMYARSKEKEGYEEKKRNSKRKHRFDQNAGYMAW